MKNVVLDPLNLARAKVREEAWRTSSLPLLSNVSRGRILDVLLGGFVAVLRSVNVTFVDVNIDSRADVGSQNLFVWPARAKLAYANGESTT